MSKKPLHPETPIVFLALYWGGPEEVDLPRLLLTFDFLNRASLTRGELETHLNILLSAGLIEMKPNEAYAIPPAVYGRFDQFRRRRRKGRFEDAEAFVRRHDWKYPAPAVIRIAEASYERAMATNSEKFG